jgi:hypothetical protein
MEREINEKGIMTRFVPKACGSLATGVKEPSIK